MSYESFKRVLGESNLERKCLLWFGMSLGLLLFLCFYYYGLRMDELVDESDRKLGPELVRAAWLEEHFYMKERLDKDYAETAANVDEETKTSAGYFDQVYNSSKTIGSDFQWFAILPFSNAVEDLPPTGEIVPSGKPGYVYYFPGEKRPSQYEYEWELLAPILNSSRPPVKTDPNDASDPRSPGEYVDAQVIVDGEQKYRYYSPLYTDRSCIDCHKIGAVGHIPRPNLAEGDLFAVICVEVDQEDARGVLASLRAWMWTAAVVIGFISMFLLYFIIRYVIVKPVQHLRDVANAVREGDVEQRAEIQTGDEFEELAASFNRMLRRLLRQQDALQEVNEELDAKIDQIAQANMRLFEMNRLKSDFLATMSHELRTPLNSILGFSDVLAGVDGLSEKQQRYVSNIQRSGRMLLEMINDILDLAKMESGKMDIRPTDFRIDAVVSAQCDMARPLTERKNIDLDCEFDPDLPMMRQDQGKVQQILNNLLSNAIKFTPEGGRIIVRAARHDGHIARLTVEDTGVGISEDDQAIVFEKFRQGGSAQPQGSAMTREQGGTGLGLSIVRELCRLLGGEVSLSSVLGKGSTFTVLLPWKVSANQNMEAHLQQEVAELTRTTLATD
ncbi:Autoinducer 2 sensor kinase/phosphatase LuxQ [Posidoniimonas corsicana]|uniref:histidine kinase n=1 Tax=Posidoniimonas corsicana TaxID=1938618 RepID=A0A5C5UXE8_9BACT|nr:HAMP domain-containing sensor histidine kinase [Posidoniimonas corsicana]TWT31016.1 Autoinducer 2 sensor kinase/phosphatase LuxQ [Posidoniimonas corsicana]